MGWKGALRLREVKLLVPPHTASEWVEPEPPTPSCCRCPSGPLPPHPLPFTPSPTTVLGSSQPVWSLDSGHSPERRCSHGWQDLLRGPELPRASHLSGKMDGDRLGAENFAKEG